MCLILLALQITLQSIGDIAGTIIGQQPWLMADVDLSEVGLGKRHFDVVPHVTRRYRLGKLPSQDLAGIGIQDSRRLVPTLSLHPQLSEVHLPEFTHSFRGLLEFVLRKCHMEDRAGDQVKVLQDAIHTRFRDEIPFSIGNLPYQLSGQFVRMCQHIQHDLVSYNIWDAVPELPGGWLGTCQPLVTNFLIVMGPAVEGAVNQIHLFQCSSNRKIRLFPQADDLHLLSLSATYHSSHVVSMPRMLFSSEHGSIERALPPSG